MFYADVLTPLLARLEGCPSALVVDALRNACIEFCSRTRWLTTGAQIVSDGENEPTFAQDINVLDICQARIDGTDILVTYINDPDLDDLEDDDNAITFATDPNNIELRIPGTTDVPITVDFVLCIAPGPESIEIPDELWRRWSEALKDGALLRLYAEPNNPWSNPQSAGYHGGRFESAITLAAAEAGRNRIQPARRLRVRPA